MPQGGPPIEKLPAISMAILVAGAQGGLPIGKLPAIPMALPMASAPGGSPNREVTSYLHGYPYGYPYSSFWGGPSEVGPHLFVLASPVLGSLVLGSPVPLGDLSLGVTQVPYCYDLLLCFLLKVSAYIAKYVLNSS